MSEHGRRRDDAARRIVARPSYLRSDAVARHRSPVMTERPPTAFEVVGAGLREAPGVAIRGEVDLDTAPAMVEALDAAIRGSHGPFVIDLCDVEFFDSSGLSALMRARALLGRENRALLVVCPPGPVRRLFDVTRVAEVLELYDSREAAVGSLAHRGPEPRVQPGDIR
jgi:anti-sigma B factor antagonist